MSSVFGHAVSITGFVFVMMLLIEYVNVLTSGLWQNIMTRSRWTQYLIAALLGAIPGCLGAFLVVGMFSHRLLSLGALVAAMVATSGDESFVMFAMIPGQALLLSISLMLLGILAGALTDVFARPSSDGCSQLVVHEQEQCCCFKHGDIVRQLKKMTPVRAVLLAFLALLIITVGGGYIGPAVWNWVRVTILTLTIISTLMVVTVPEHFLTEHLWQHVVKQHLPRIFGWTLAMLLLMHFLTENLQLDAFSGDGRWIVLLLACLVGLIPESGPHLIFLTLYVQGSLPLSILLASSIVQDGHGMLPLLAHSRRDFALVKIINFAFGLGVGALGLLVGL